MAKDVNVRARAARNTGVPQFPQKISHVLAACGISKSVFINEFTKSTKTDKKKVGGWLDGSATLYTPSIDKLVPYLKTKGVEITSAEFFDELEEFKKRFDEKYTHHHLPLRLCFGLNEIGNQERLAGKYKVYRYSLANNKLITEEWLIIEPAGDLSHSMKITIHNYPASGAPKEQFEGIVFQIGGSYHAIVSSRDSPPRRVRLLLFGVPQSWEDPVVLYGVVVGASLAEQGNPVATCFVAGRVSPAAPLTELERRHIARIDQEGHRRFAPVPPGEEGIITPSGWNEVPIVNEVIKRMISSDVILCTDNNSVLRADQADAHLARDHFEKVKAWYEANPQVPAHG